MTLFSNSLSLLQNDKSLNRATTLSAADTKAQAQHASNEDINRFNQALGESTTETTLRSTPNGQITNTASNTQSELSSMFSRLMGTSSNGIKPSAPDTPLDVDARHDAQAAQAQASATASDLALSSQLMPNDTLGTVTGNMPHAGEPSNVGNSGPINANSSVQELLDHLVERILVADPKFIQGSEVRLLLGANTGSLQGSEIILHRSLEGMLAVKINCRDQNQFKKFVEIRSDLKTALEQHEETECQLLIERPTL